MQLGTKNKQRRRAQSKRVGLQTQPAKRATRENIGTFVKGQKLRDGEPMSERYTAAIVRGAAKVRTLTPRQRRKLASEAPGASSDVSQAVKLTAKQPKPAPQPYARKRNALRAAGMRYVRETGPGLNVNAPGSWVDATGVTGIPTIGTLRVHVRRMAREWYQSEINSAREMISMPARSGMTMGATLEAEGDVSEVG